jgi:hypothetical protein
MGREGDALTAHTYIFMQDVPRVMTAMAMRVQRQESGGSVEIVAFPECPFVGEVTKVEAGEQIEFPFPRDISLRTALIDWLVYWGINFTVVM